VRAREVDVVVAGAGPAGTAAAIALARAGRRVLLADPLDAPLGELKVGETLPAVAGAVLRDLGLPDVESAGVAIPSAGTSAAWGTGGPLESDAVADPHGRGWHLDRTRFDAWLREEARAAGAELCAGRVALEGRAAPEGSATPEGSAVVRILGGPEPAAVACRRLVDATGRRAAIARGQGARRERGDRLVALYGAVSTAAEDRDTRTRLEAMASGWWYSALVGDGRRIVAFLTDADLVEPGWRSSDGFRAALGATSHIVPAGDPAKLAFGPATTAAHGSRLAPAAGDGWLAVGDAALAFDPLSSQGILNALVTGLQGAAAVDASLRGDTDAVAAYEERLARVWSAYEVNRSRAYALESRWPDSPFWARRRVASATLG
jgi:flavin-dependent dehydrogenase